LNDGLMIHWSPDPVLVHLGPLQIRWYGLLFLSGFYLGLYFMQGVCRRENKPPQKLDTLLVYMIAGTTIGARLAHCFFYEWDYYSQHLLEILMIWKGGLASHGGGAGVVIALFIFSRRNPEFSFSWLCDRMALPLVLTGSLIRLGNLMNSEIIGQPTNLPWAFVFDRVDQVPRHPAQIYESLWYFATWLVGIFLYRKFKYKPPVGLLFGWVVTAIFVGRILIELVKENQEAFEANMTLNLGQWLSIPWLLAGCFLFFRALIQARKKNKKQT
jgi:phosphatidylglycerol:prolipoprotein diacylglycerol transferase